MILTGSTLYSKRLLPQWLVLQLRFAIQSMSSHATCVCTSLSQEAVTVNADIISDQVVNESTPWLNDLIWLRQLQERLDGGVIVPKRSILDSVSMKPLFDQREIIGK